MVSVPDWSEARQECEASATRFHAKPPGTQRISLFWSHWRPWRLCVRSDPQVSTDEYQGRGGVRRISATRPRAPVPNPADAKRQNANTASDPVCSRDSLTRRPERTTSGRLPGRRRGALPGRISPWRLGIRTALIRCKGCALCVFGIGGKRHGRTPVSICEPQRSQRETVSPTSPRTELPGTDLHCGDRHCTARCACSATIVTIVGEAPEIPSATAICRVAAAVTSVYSGDSGTTHPFDFA